jgi:hypothetical protein
MPSKCKALSSNLRNWDKRKEEREREGWGEGRGEERRMFIMKIK